jgi:hypothetical protein
VRIEPLTTADIASAVELAVRVLRVKPGDRGEQFAADITGERRQMFVAKAAGRVVGYGRVMELAAGEAGAETPAGYYLSGVLRALTVNVFEWRTGHDPSAGRRAALLAPIIAAFAIGAGVGGLCTRLLHHQAAWVAAAALLVVLVAIVIGTWKLDRREKPPHTP